MWKTIVSIFIAVAVVVVIGVILFGKGGGIGGGAGEGEGDGNTSMVTNMESANDEENNTIIQEDEEDVITEEENNGAIDRYEGAIVKVSVVENEYFSDNERISLEDLKIYLRQIEGDYVVEVKDDNASLRAYDELIEMLEEEKIKYVEE